MDESCRALIVGTVGVEVDLLVPRSLRGQVHVWQPWCPFACWCGVTHNLGDRMDVAIFVGVDLPRAPSNAELVIGVVPKAGALRKRPYPLVKTDEERDFGPWAADFIAHLLNSLMKPSLVGIDYATMQRFFAGAAEFGFSNNSTSASTARSAFLHIVGGTTLTLCEVNDLADRWSRVLGEEGIVAVTIDEAQAAPRLSAIFTR